MLVKSSVKAEADAVRRPAHRSVYDTLSRQVLFGDLIPGQSVTIQGLCEGLGAGMTPVREALRRLVSDGALEMQENRRIIVPVLTPDCIDQLEFMRETLETELVRRAAVHAGQHLLDTLRAEDAALDRAIAKGDVRGYLTHNFRFHGTVHAAAGAPMIAATVHRLWLRFGPSLRVVCGRHGTLGLPDKHIDLIEALAKGQADAAVEALSEDIRQGMGQVRTAAQETGSGDSIDSP